LCQFLIVLTVNAFDALNNGFVTHIDDSLFKVTTVDS